MEAKKMFNFLLKQIEKSELNYAISRTPFSASISLKSSFVKKLSSSNGQCAQLDIKDEPKVRTSETIELQAEVQNLLKVVSEQKDTIQEKLKNVKIIKKDSEDQVAQFRVELLKVKSERSTLHAKAKNLEDEINLLKEAIEVAKKETVAAKKLLTDEAKKHNIEMKKVKKENDESLIELTTQMKQSVVESTKYGCELCDYQFDNLVALKGHIRTHHCRDASSQESELASNKTYANFSKYHCFYCRKLLESRKNLEEHKPICFTIKKFTAYPCELCGAQCPEKASLARHRTRYHKLGTFSEELQQELYWCDVCPYNHRTYLEVEVHMKCCHNK